MCFVHAAAKAVGVRKSLGGTPVPVRVRPQAPHHPPPASTVVLAAAQAVRVAFGNPRPHARDRRRQARASKVRGNSWFVGGEQARCSRQLLRIISGELVLSQPNKFGRRDAVIADHPVPIRNPSRMAYDMKTGRLVLRTIPLPQPTLPSFTNALAKFFDRADVDGNSYPDRLA